MYTCINKWLNNLSYFSPSAKNARTPVRRLGGQFELVLGNFSSHAHTTSRQPQLRYLRPPYLWGTEMSTKDSTIRFMYFYYYYIAQTTAWLAISHIAGTAAAAAVAAGVRDSIMKGAEGEGRASTTRCNPTTTIVVAHIQVWMTHWSGDASVASMYCIIVH